jgi:hypothetical protein
VKPAALVAFAVFAAAIAVLLALARGFARRARRERDEELLRAEIDRLGED